MTNKHENISVIITAGGIGKRMGSELPKQFLKVNSYPILIHTLSAFYNALPTSQIIITLPESWKEYWNDLINEYEINIPHHVVSGGDERYHSVQKALEICQGEIILIHDGVRPMVSSELIKRCLRKITEGSVGVVPVVSAKESMRRLTNEGTEVVNRSEYLTVQTPQCFNSEAIRQAYSLPYDPSVFDDAILVERAGHQIDTVPGEAENIKITEKFDLKIAELHLK